MNTSGRSEKLFEENRSNQEVIEYLKSVNEMNLRKHAIQQLEKHLQEKTKQLKMEENELYKKKQITCKPNKEKIEALGKIERSKMRMNKMLSLYNSTCKQLNRLRAELIAKKTIQVRPFETKIELLTALLKRMQEESDNVKNELAIRKECEYRMNCIKESVNDYFTQLQQQYDQQQQENNQNNIEGNVMIDENEVANYDNDMNNTNNENLMDGECQNGVAMKNPRMTSSSSESSDNNSVQEVATSTESTNSHGNDNNTDNNSISSNEDKETNHAVHEHLTIDLFK